MLKLACRSPKHSEILAGSRQQNSIKRINVGLHSDKDIARIRLCPVVGKVAGQRKVAGNFDCVLNASK